MKLFAGVCALLLSVRVGGAQARLESVDPESISAADRAALSGVTKLNQLDCSISWAKPAMAIDLRFHSGFSVAIPLKKLAGEAGAIRTLVRVTPASEPARAAFLAMTTPKPAIESNLKGSVELSGAYAVGPGRYAVDWLLSFGDRVCRKHWQIEAKLDRAFSAVPLAIAADTAAELPPDPFNEPDRVISRAAQPLYVKVLVNFSPAGGNGAPLADQDVRVVTAILRAVSREPRFGRFSVVAFSSEQGQVLQRQPMATKIDFHALGRAVRQLSSGVVSIKQIQDPDSTARFLESLLAHELSVGEPAPNAVVVISPKVSVEEDISERELRKRTRLQCPVFLLSYNPRPIADPWQGLLGKVVKKVYRGLQYTIAGPRDLGKALDRLESELSGRQ